MKLTEPWSKKHKAVTKHGGLPHNLSNSFAQPLTMGELLRLTRARGDAALLALYEDHDLGYTPNGGSRDLREAVAELYGPSVGADGVVVFTGAQVALQTAALALVDETAHAIAFAPGYQSVLEAPVHAGAAVTSIPLSPANGWAVDVAAVRAAIRPNTRYMARRPRPDSRDEGSPPTRCARSSRRAPGRRRSARAPRRSTRRAPTRRLVGPEPALQPGGHAAPEGRLRRARRARARARHLGPLRRGLSPARARRGRPAPRAGAASPSSLVPRRTKHDTRRWPTPTSGG